MTGSTWANILYLYLYFPGSTTTRHGQRIGLPDRSSPTARRAATKIKLGSFFFLLSQKEGWNTTRRQPPPATKIKLGNTAIGSCGRPIEERDRAPPTANNESSQTKSCGIPLSALVGKAA